MVNTWFGIARINIHADIHGQGEVDDFHVSALRLPLELNSIVSRNYITLILTINIRLLWILV